MFWTDTTVCVTERVGCNAWMSNVSDFDISMVLPFLFIPLFFFPFSLTVFQLYFLCLLIFFTSAQLSSSIFSICWLCKSHRPLPPSSDFLCLLSVVSVTRTLYSYMLIHFWGFCICPLFLFSNSLSFLHPPSFSSSPLFPLSLPSLSLSVSSFCFYVASLSLASSVSPSLFRLLEIDCQRLLPVKIWAVTGSPLGQSQP